MHRLQNCGLKHHSFIHPFIHFYIIVSFQVRCFRSLPEESRLQRKLCQGDVPERRGSAVHLSFPESRECAERGFDPHTRDQTGRLRARGLSTYGHQLWKGQTAGYFSVWIQKVRHGVLCVKLEIIRGKDQA